MYKGKEDLRKLTESLTIGEKRHFTGLYEMEMGRENPPLFLQLYQELENGRNQFSKSLLETAPRALTAAKRRLYDNILSSLRLLHEVVSIDIMLQNNLSAIEILYKRGLPEQGLAILRRAYILAQEHEKFALLLQVLDWEKRLNIVLDNPNRSTDEIKQEERDISHKLVQIMQLESIYSQVMVLKKRYGLVKGENRKQLEKETILSAGMPRLKDCKSHKAVYYYNLIMAVYHWMIFDHKKAYEYSKQLLDKNNNILPNDFITGIFQHITSSVCLGYFQDALNGIELGNAFLEEHRLSHSNSFKILMFGYQSTYRIIAYNYTGNKNELSQTIKETERQFDQIQKMLSIEMRQVVLGNLMNAYMGTGNLDKADRICSMLQDKEYRNSRRDIQADLYLFRLFSLLHSKTYSLLPSASLSAMRFFKKFDDAEKAFEVELPIAKLLLKERNYENQDLLRQTLTLMKKYVLDFVSSLKGLNDFQEHYSRYIIWCDAIAEDVPFYEAAQKWYAAWSGEHKRN